MKDHYSMHSHNTWRRTPRRTLLRVKLRALERRVLDKLSSFSVWGGGRDGRNFVNDLSENNRRKVKCFGDVDVKKVLDSRKVKSRLEPDM